MRRARPRPHRRPRARAHTDAAGFTFIEVLIVMGIMAVLMGLGVGFLQNVGRSSQAQQARAILKETAFACKQSSNGGTQATLELRERETLDGREIVVGAMTAAPVLTHQFETLDQASLDFPIEVQGSVSTTEAGYTGRAARFERGASLSLGAQPSFAMTDGLALDVRLKPEEGPPTMTLVRGEGAYDIALVKAREGRAYDVRVKLTLTSAAAAREAAEVKEFRTTTGPVRPDGGWSHLQVRWDGEMVSVRVDGLEQMEGARKRAPRTPTTPGPGAPAPDLRRRLVVPAGGVVPLRISAPDSGYVGLMDNLVLGGVFRAADVERRLRGLVFVRPDLPIRVTWVNGRLDPAQHADDVVIVFREEANPRGPFVQLRLGRHGTIEDRLTSGGAP